MSTDSRFGFESEREMHPDISVKSRIEASCVRTCMMAAIQLYQECISSVCFPGILSKSNMRDYEDEIFRQASAVCVCYHGYLTPPPPPPPHTHTPAISVKVTCAELKSGRRWHNDIVL